MRKITIILILFLGITNLLNAQRTQIGADIDGKGGGDYSGYSVSLSSDGSMIAIGAPFNFGSGSTSGHVRVL